MAVRMWVGYRSLPRADADVHVLDVAVVLLYG
jgi:hypothetical protein